MPIKKYSIILSMAVALAIWTYGSYKKNNPNMKYILQWTSPRKAPLSFLGKEQQFFVGASCPHTNCFVTADRYYLGDYTNFDVIAFSGAEVFRMKKESLPQRRSPHQKFTFASMESSDNYPICSDILNGFFNWTWTYKLKSDAVWGYMAIKDSNGAVIGPKKIMHWMKFEDMEPVSDDLKIILKRKTKAAAWFSSKCAVRSRRSRFVEILQKELAKYGRNVDVYGRCGNLTCSPKRHLYCDSLLDNNYFFYLALENSFSEDYVTEKLLRALQHNAIPIVLGSANYSRFLPEGSYINAIHQDIEKLAAIMNELINDVDKYSEFFKWKRYYSYHKLEETRETNQFCHVCALLNDEQKMNEITIYEDIKKWWNTPGRC